MKRCLLFPSVSLKLYAIPSQAHLDLLGQKGIGIRQQTHHFTHGWRLINGKPTCGMNPWILDISRQTEHTLTAKCKGSRCDSKPVYWLHRKIPENNIRWFRSSATVAGSRNKWASPWHGPYRHVLYIESLGMFTPKNDPDYQHTMFSW